MLSILIPIYNQDVRKLVLGLAHQCQKEGIYYQVLCYDDGSREKYRLINRKLQSVYGVSYLEFSPNMGRSRIRNKLGYNAMYEHMIFLDCDSRVKAKRYIKNYLNVLKDHDVIYGGTVYSQRRPKSKKKILHWKYGQLREKLPMKKRMQAPWSSFRSNNFMIKRSIFLDHMFDERIKGYGHEDTLFAQSLKEAGIRIHHIQNPVQHGGIETTDVFLDKVRESVSNLAKLRHNGIEIDTALTRGYDKLNRLGLLPLVRRFWSLSNSGVMSNLMGPKPRMLALDLFKLSIYDDEIKKAPQ